LLLLHIHSSEVSRFISLCRQLNSLPTPYLLAACNVVCLPPSFLNSPLDPPQHLLLLLLLSRQLQVTLPYFLRTSCYSLLLQPRCCRRCCLLAALLLMTMVEVCR
jgi:hypothetical protein